MRYPVVPVALVLLALAACDGEGFDAGQYDVTGRWTGSALADTIQLDLRLEQDEEEITGSGTLRAGGETVEVTVLGDFDFPGVDLRLAAPGFVPVVLDGTFEQDTIITINARGDTIRTPRESRSRISGTLTGSSLSQGRFRILRDTLTP